MTGINPLYVFYGVLPKSLEEAVVTCQGDFSDIMKEKDKEIYELKIRLQIYAELLEKSTNIITTKPVA